MSHGSTTMTEQRHLPQEAGYSLRLRHPDFEDHFAVWDGRERAGCARPSPAPSTSATARAPT